MIAETWQDAEIGIIYHFDLATAAGAGYAIFTAPPAIRRLAVFDTGAK